MSEKLKQIVVLGLMSGSSLDGVDIAAVHFSYAVHPEFEINAYQIHAADTFEYTEKWLNTLTSMSGMAFDDYFFFDFELGTYYAELINKFNEKHHISPALLAIHGHTVLHDPVRHVSVQMGAGHAIHAGTDLPVICDLRSMDVALGGEGAPMAPIADQYIFGTYDAVLNLGGIANVSVKTDTGWQGFDICPANQILNYLARKMNVPYDAGGRIASAGIIQPALLDKLNADPYLSRSIPKSLSNEYVAQYYFPILDGHITTVENKMATATAFIAAKIYDAISQISASNGKILSTGGGSHNLHLLNQIKSILPNTLVPDDELINYKECILTALIGLMRQLRVPNFKKAITGGRKDNLGGVIIES
jgi:anhydro-N-acetylmuramic acid kinase